MGFLLLFVNFLFLLISCFKFFQKFLFEFWFCCISFMNWVSFFRDKMLFLKIDCRGDVWIECGECFKLEVGRGCRDVQVDIFRIFFLLLWFYEGLGIFVLFGVQYLRVGILGSSGWGCYLLGRVFCVEFGVGLYLAFFFVFFSSFGVW